MQGQHELVSLQRRGERGGDRAGCDEEEEKEASRKLRLRGLLFPTAGPFPVSSTAADVWNAETALAAAIRDGTAAAFGVRYSPSSRPTGTPPPLLLTCAGAPPLAATLLPSPDPVSSLQRITYISQD
ncbi:hypothetical protein GUJ93_ZPchr0012g22110 [Zizania palustris]|uniref:Uncharacterized protein n=1 Tax=Zizania palustris TaxID=103762 RepID=A0A8J5WMN9_ZIZPA|nr:hypothetical protein GUJ93_ZPchr0012g22110 [Zizania palustris]